MFVRVRVLSNNSQSLISMSKLLCLPGQQCAQRLPEFCPPFLSAPQKVQMGGMSKGLRVFVCVDENRDGPTQTPFSLLMMELIHQSGLGF